MAPVQEELRSVKYEHLVVRSLFSDAAVVWFGWLRPSGVCWLRVEVRVKVRVRA